MILQSCEVSRRTKAGLVVVWRTVEKLNWSLLLLRRPCAERAGTLPIGVTRLWKSTSVTKIQRIVVGGFFANRVTNKTWPSAGCLYLRECCRLSFRIVCVRETRVTGIMSHVLIGLSVFYIHQLQLIPRPVLDGLFLYLAITALHSNQLFERIMLLVTEQVC